MTDNEFECQADNWSEYLEGKVWSPHRKAYVDAPPMTPVEDMSLPQRRAARLALKWDMQDATPETLAEVQQWDADNVD